MGIVRVSRKAGREGERFVSPTEQRERIEAACERDGLRLAEVHEEIEVSGGTPLERRDGLRAAIEAIEAGEVSVLVVAYFDRLVRSLRVQGEVVSRVEEAGGSVLTVDVGAVSEKTASQWLSGTMLGAVAEYQRRSAAERSRAAQAAAVARGVPPWNNITPGYRKGEDGRLVPTKEARFVRKAFQMRDEGATIMAIRAYLRERGVERSAHGVTTLLESRVVLGEIHHGNLVNLEAHKPIVDRELWNRVQRMKVSRGRRPKSQRLLARLGVLRCGTCDARMVIGHVRGRYPFYRCPPNADCPRRVTVAASIVEPAVEDAVRRHLADVEGRASVEANVRSAEAEAERDQENLDAAIRAFAGVEGEQAAVGRLAELTAIRDASRERVEQLGGGAGTRIFKLAAEWDRLTREERRGFIRLTLERVSIAPGRGPGRLSFHFFA